MNWILSPLVFFVVYGLQLAALKKRYWGIAIAEYTIILCLLIMNGLIWKNHELIFFSDAAVFVYLGAGGASFLMTFINRKNKSR